MDPNKRKDKIAEGAQKMIRKEGHFNLSLNHLAQVVGIPYTTIYRTFSTKSNLIAYCLLKGMQSMPDCLNELERMKISNKEKMMVVACFPYYCCSFDRGHGTLELMFSGANTVLIREASDEYKQQISQTQQMLYRLRWEFFRRCGRAGLVDYSDVELKKLYRLLHLLSRGGAHMAYHRRFSDEEYSLDEMMALTETLLRGLPWKPNETVNPHQVKAAMRTFSDKWQ